MKCFMEEDGIANSNASFVHPSACSYFYKRFHVVVRLFSDRTLDYVKIW